MILHKLTLNNVGLFRGTQTIDLTPNGRGPIILIGGMNGSGKTTLLDAVRLCLYGRRALGNRVSNNEYYDYLSAMIHRGSDAEIPLNHAAVLLEFEYAHGVETKQYRVERAWQQYGSNHRSISEKLTVSENDLLDTEFEAEHWQDQVDELIPIGVSQFFFFDGEDIQQLADNSSHDLSLAESIKGLLGLNLVERLQSDLRIYANHLLKHSSPEPVEKEIEEVELEIATLTSSLAEVEKQAESLHAQIENIETQIVQQESRVTAEGGSYVERRERLKLQQRQLLVDIEVLENEIRDLCEGLFPFILVPDLLKRLAKHLLKEIELGEWESKSRALQAVNKEVLETLASVKFWDDTSLSVSQIAIVHTKIAPLLKTQLERPAELLDFKRIRDRSRSECGRLLAWIDICLYNVPQEFSELNDALKEVRLELQKVKQA